MQHDAVCSSRALQELDGLSSPSCTAVAKDQAVHHRSGSCHRKVHGRCTAGAHARVPVPSGPQRAGAPGVGVLALVSPVLLVRGLGPVADAVQAVMVCTFPAAGSATTFGCNEGFHPATASAFVMRAYSGLCTCQHCIPKPASNKLRRTLNVVAEVVAELAPHDRLL